MSFAQVPFKNNVEKERREQKEDVSKIVSYTAQQIFIFF